MLAYKHLKYLAYDSSPAFDNLHAAGEITPHSGIYRCEGCARNELSIGGHPLPVPHHHQHTPEQGDILWRLAVSL
jgi:hypothetical protein